MRRPVHYAPSKGPAIADCACGVASWRKVEVVDGESFERWTPRITDDRDRVTCEACARAMGRAAPARRAGA